jgi:hypothetical protein
MDLEANANAQKRTPIAIQTATRLLPEDADPDSPFTGG